VSGHDHGSRDCREIFERLSEYLDQELDPELCSKIEGHLDGCEPCEAFLESLRRTIGHVGESRSEALPDEIREQLRRALKALRDAGGPQ
jgi:anti-sigma factor (TIGR02949 family)